MLDILRKHASTWLIKFILGTIVVVFIFYFGTTTFRRGNKALHEDVVASVNGDPITRLELHGTIEKVKDQNPDLYKSIPEAMLKQFENSILGGIIEERVVQKEAEKMGLTVSNKEVAYTIQNNPSFAKDGKFNEFEYREKFRPWHLSHYGFDFEDWIRNILLVQKVKKVFADAVLVSDDRLKKTYEMSRTRIKLKKIGFKDNEKTTADLVARLWPLYLRGRSLSGPLKDNNLTETETPFVSLLDTENIFDGTFDASAASQLFGLSKNNPYPAGPIKVGNRPYFFKLVDKETPDWDEFEKNKTAEREKIREQMAQAAYQKWYREKASVAKIEIKGTDFSE